METTVERRVDPRNMPFHIKLADAPTISVQVDAYSARRRVNGWLASAVGGLLLADTPTLTLELGHPHWSVPVLLTSSSGPRGVVGWEIGRAHV